MDRRMTLVVFLSLWCLSHQQGQEMTLCRGDKSVMAECGAGMTPFPGQLAPGWGRTCEAGTTPCILTTQNTVESTQYYTAYRCDSETWNLNYLCLPGTGSYDIECGRLDHDVTESTGNTLPITTTVHTNREFEATSIDNPSSTNSAAGSGDGGEGPQINGIIIGLSVALAIVVVLWLLSVGYLLRRSRLTPGKPSHGEDHQNSMNMERQTRTTVANNNVQEPSLSAKNESGVECQNDGRDVTMDTSGVYETVRDRDPAIQNRDVHHNEGQGRDGPNAEHIDLSSVTMNQPPRYQSSTELALQDNTLYGSPM